MAAAYPGDTFRAMLRGTCLAMLCALHAVALASPRSDPTEGRAVFTGAATAHPTSLDVNPAALGVGLNDATEAYFAATGTLDHIAIDRQDLDVDTGALTPGASVSGNLLSPGGTAAVIWHSGAGGRVTLGAALHSSPAERWLENEDAIRYHTLGGSQRTYSLSVGASFKLVGRVYAGVSLALSPTVLHLRFARDSALAAGRDPTRGIGSDCGGAPCGIGNPQATEIYDVNVRSNWVALDNVVPTIGVVVKLARDMWLGFSYHTPPGLSVQNELTGTMDVTRAPRDGGETINGGATVYLSQPASFDLELRAALTDTLELHVGSRLEDLSRMRAYDVRGYDSQFRNANIPEWQLRPRGFRDAVPPSVDWALSVATWAGIEQVERTFPLLLGARVGFETSSLKDDTTSPTTIAPTSLTLDAGLQYRLTPDRDTYPQVILQAQYGLQYYPKVSVRDSDYDPRAQLDCYDSGYDYSTRACELVRNGYGIDTAAGDYQRIQQAMRVALKLVW
jgi:hypothetical protein